MAELEIFNRQPTRQANDELINEVFGDWEDASEEEKEKSPKNSTS